MEDVLYQEGHDNKIGYETEYNNNYIRYPDSAYRKTSFLNVEVNISSKEKNKILSYNRKNKGRDICIVLPKKIKIGKKFYNTKIEDST